MRGKSLALLVLALGCGLVASLGITQVLAKRGDSTVPADTAPVYVAKVDMQPGTMANSDTVKLEQWPKDHLPADALGRQEQVEGRRVKYAIFAGQPILEPMLLHAGEVSMDAQIPSGMRVVPVPVSSEAIHSGLVVPGSRCDVQVFIKADAGLGIGETISKTILQDIRVFAVNDITSTQQMNSDPKMPEQHTIPAGKTVSLLVTPPQADIVTLASNLGTIRLVLRSAEDSAQTKNRTLSARELLGGYVTGNRDLENKEAKEFSKWVEMMKSALSAPAPAPQPTAPRHNDPAKYTMRVRSGTEISDVVMVANASPAEANGDDVSWTPTNLPIEGKTVPESRATNTAPSAGSPSGAPAKQLIEALQPVLKVNGKPPLGS